VAGGLRAAGWPAAPARLLDTTRRETPMVERQMPAIRGSEQCPASVGSRPHRPEDTERQAGNLELWLLRRCLAVTLIAGTLTSICWAVVTAPAAAGKFANYFSLNPCKILPSSDIAAIIRVKSTHQTFSIGTRTHVVGPLGI